MCSCVVPSLPSPLPFLLVPQDCTGSFSLVFRVRVRVCSKVGDELHDDVALGGIAGRRGERGGGREVRTDVGVYKGRVRGEAILDFGKAEPVALHKGTNAVPDPIVIGVHLSDL
jgi:hypothetical protein